MSPLEEASTLLWEDQPAGAVTDLWAVAIAEQIVTTVTNSGRGRVISPSGTRRINPAACLTLSAVTTIPAVDAEGAAQSFTP